MKYLLSTPNYLLEPLAALPNKINHLHLNTEVTTVLFFIIVFHVFLNSFCELVNKHIPLLIPFSTINNISISVKRSNCTFILFEAACHTNQEPKEILHNQSHIFLYTYL